MSSQTISKNEAYEFLKTVPLAVFGTVSNENTPHLTTLFYIVDKDLNFYFISRSQTAKIDNISRGSKVSIVVSDRHSFITVQAQGVAIQLSGVEKIRTIFKMFTDVYKTQGIIQKGKLFNWAPPIENVDNGDIVIYEVKPEWVRYVDYKSASPLDGNAMQEVIL